MLPLFKVFMHDSTSTELTKTLNSGFITQGPKVEEFETKLKDYLDAKYVLTLNSGTSGLNLAMRLLINPDPATNWPGFHKLTDEVLTPALTCFATTASILTHDVNIKWIDVDPKTCCVDLNDIRKKLSYNTKIIYIVHWGGTPCDLKGLYEIQNEHFEKYGYHPMIVEDCAHAFGAEYSPGVKIGNHPRNICVFSLQAIKHLTTGDGGIITVPNKTLYDRAKLLRWYGIDRDQRNYNQKDFRLEQDIIEAGYKYHMNDINATIGISNLSSMDSLLQINRNNADFYDKVLKDVVGLTILKPNENTKSAYWLYTILVDNKEAFMEKMKVCEIMVSQVHNRNDIYSCVKQFKTPLPNLDIIEKKMVCIPVGWWLKTSDLEYIVNCIKSGW